MHETLLAKDLLRVVLERAEGARVLEVKGTIAETEALRPDVLDFHFQAHARGTLAEGARLDLRLVHVRARCGRCGHEYRPDHHATVCPRCSCAEAELLGATGVSLDSMEVE